MEHNAYLEMARNEENHWWFRARRNILSRFIGKLNLPQGARILEIGSGTGGNLGMLSEFGHVSALEMDAGACTLAAQKLPGAIDIKQGVCPHDIPFPAGSFDLICLFDVLEHIEEDEDSLRIIQTLMKKNGYILITVPAYKWMWSPHDTFLHHKRRYTAGLLRKISQKAELQVTVLTYFNTLLFPLAAVVRMKDKIFRNKKASGASIPFGPLNSLLYSLFAWERFLVRKVPLPFGLSLLCLLENKKQ